MKKELLWVWMAWFGAGAWALAAEGPVKTKAAVEKEVAPAKGVAPEELEAAFVKALARVLFKGRWCTVEKGTMGEARDEQYEIVGAMKTGGDRWVINARIQYGTINLVAPVPVQVKWAGDTPVIVVDQFTLPGAGTYSARVMIFGDTYSGTWSAGDHGGLLQGVIAKQP